MDEQTPSGGELIIRSSQTVDFRVNPGNLYLISGTLGPVGSTPTGLSGEFGGNIILQLGHERQECVRFTPDGKVYVRGELVEDNKEAWEAVKAWLMTSSIHRGVPDFTVSKE